MSQPWPKPIDEKTVVMWSPKAPMRTNPAMSASSKSFSDEHDKSLPLVADNPHPSSYEPVVKVRQRIAHEESLSKSHEKRPVYPAGVSKKVPAVVRQKYLNQFIKELIKCSKEDANIVDIHKEAVDEEKKICDRASSKTIYMSLAAALIKRFRDRSGIQTLQEPEDGYINGNKVVSHDKIITGKVNGTFSIKRPLKPIDPHQMTGPELYRRFTRYVVPLNEMEDYGYPIEDPENPGCPKFSKLPPIRLEDPVSFTCDRCQKTYYVDEQRVPIMKNGPCIYHSGRLWQERFNRSMERRYSCCKGEPNSGGCSSCAHHVHLGHDETELRQNFVRTTPKDNIGPNEHGVYALDCEMCYTTVGLELTRVTVIDHKCDVIYERLVKPPRRILDYNSKFSGINEGELDNVTTTIEDVHKDLLEMFSDKTILVGHSLDSDLRALKMIHYTVVDTAQMFPHKRGLPYKRALRTLMREYLLKIIQEDAGHDSKEDASACMELVLWKIKSDGTGKRAKID